MNALKVALRILGGAFTVLYPLAIFYGLTQYGARVVSVLVLAVAAVIALVRPRRADATTRAMAVRVPIAISILVLCGVVTDDPRFVLALPVLINGVLLAEFGSTLRQGATPMIERFARLVEPELDDLQRLHCRQWTIGWCVFFVANGATALMLGLLAPIWWWTVYVGGVAYALTGLMFAAEYVHRRIRLRRRDAERPAS